jgi:hypothetical protein
VSVVVVAGNGAACAADAQEHAIVSRAGSNDL